MIPPTAGSPPSFDEFIRWLASELGDEPSPDTRPSDELADLGWDSLRIAEACLICLGESGAAAMPDTVRRVGDLYQIHLDEGSWA